jgi:hypothetical protein
MVAKSAHEIAGFTVGSGAASAPPDPASTRLRIKKTGRHKANMAFAILLIEMASLVGSRTQRVALWIFAASIGGPRNLRSSRQTILMFSGRTVKYQ